jgi:hypothetical protein
MRPEAAIGFQCPKAVTDRNIFYKVVVCYRRWIESRPTIALQSLKPVNGRLPLVQWNANQQAVVNFSIAAKAVNRMVLSTCQVIPNAFFIMEPIPIHSEIRSVRWVVRILAALSVLAFIGAVVQCMEPSVPPFRGRLAWIVEAVFSLMGSAGIVLLWSLLGVALVASARFIWRHTGVIQQLAPKVSMGANLLIV